MVKKIISVVIITVMALSMLALTACAKSEFGMSENTGKLMVIEAKNADKDAFFMVGSLEVNEGDEVFVTSNLEKGTVKVELIAEEEDQSVDELPDFDGEPIAMFNASGTDMMSFSLNPGNYMLRATCTEKATGTVTIESKPAE